MLKSQLRLALGVAGIGIAAYLPFSGCANHARETLISEPHSPLDAASFEPRVRTIYSSTPEGEAVSGDARAQRVKQVVESVRTGLLGDGRLAELSEWAGNVRAKTGETPSTIQVDHMARQLGIVAPFPLLLFVDLNAPTWERDLERALRAQPKSSLHNRLGVHVDRSGRAVITMVASNADVTPVKRRIDAGAPLRLQAKLNDGWREPEWLVTSPDGRVQRVTAEAQTELRELAHGTHQIELLARGPHGLEVVANFPVGVGVDPDFADSKLEAIDWKPTPEAFLEALNQERKVAGLPPLKREAKLDTIAMAHTRDMFENHFFAHESAETGTTHERMRKAGFPFAKYGENIGRARSPGEIHTLWMRSPGHRANLLDPKFTHVGFGIVVDRSVSPPIVIATQVFGGD